MATLCSLTRHYTPCDSRIDQLLEVEPPAVPCAPFGCNWLCVLHLFLERTASDGNSEVLRGICCVRLEQNGNYLHPNCESSTIRIYTYTTPYWQFGSSKRKSGPRLMHGAFMRNSLGDCVLCMHN